MIRFGLPTLITCIGVQSLSAGIPLRFFAELLGILSGESFPPKKIVHHIPLGIYSTGESILAREFPGEFMNYHDYGMPLFASHTGSRRISGGGPVVDSTCAAAIVAGATGLRA